MRTSKVGRMRRSRRLPARHAAQRGFTLIELLVVVAIIGLLMSILLPSLQRAREQGKASVCGSNLHSVGQAFAAYLAENRAVYPVAYWYILDTGGGYSYSRQPAEPVYGYVHWSAMLYDGGKVDPKAFQCPAIPNRGHPRTNPGPDPGHWEDQQVDQNRQARPGGSGEHRVEDQQAPRMAYTANAAVVPRNKMGVGENFPGGDPRRRNKWVRETEIEETGRTVLVTEFNRNWTVVAVGAEGEGFLSKSHRPINPFYTGISYNEYDAPFDQAVYRYWFNQNDYNHGLLPLHDLEDTFEGRAEQHQFSEFNYVGRHHPGGDELGGTANFLYCDGSVRRKTILRTILDREWGRAFYGMNGNNRCFEAGYSYIPRRP